MIVFCRSTRTLPRGQSASNPVIVDPQRDQELRNRRIEEEMSSSTFVVQAKIMGFDERHIKEAMKRYRCALSFRHGNRNGSGGSFGFAAAKSAKRGRGWPAPGDTISFLYLVPMIYLDRKRTQFSVKTFFCRSSPTLRQNFH